METSQGAKQTAAVNLGALLDASDSAVVTLVAGDTRLVAHRAVLVARSPVFAAMLCNSTLEASIGDVAVPDVEGEVLQQLLTYFYTLQVPQLPDTAPQLLAIADKYGLSVLKAECEQQVAAQLSVETAATTAVLAVRHSCTRLRQAAVAFIKANLVSVMATQGWADAMRRQPENLIEVCQLLSDPPAETRLDKTVTEAGNVFLEETCLHGVLGDNLKIAADSLTHDVGSSAPAEVFCTQDKIPCIRNDCSLNEKESQHFTCSSCHQRFSSKFGVSIDSVLPLALTCLWCVEAFPREGSSRNLSNMLPGIGNQELQCDRITKEFRRIHSYEVMCSDNRPSKFEFSDKYLTSANNLNPQGFHAHEKVLTQSNIPKKGAILHASGRKHKCHVCGKSFSKSFNLQTHSLLHTGEKPYKCNFCRRSFNYSNNLKKHTLVHTVKRPHKCGICGKSFTQLDDLRAHSSRHIGHGRHLCDVCGKSFAHSRGLKKHLVTHTGERPHKCIICDKTFPFMYSLKRHTLVHTGNRPHKCDKCTESFTRRDHLRRHALTHADQRTNTVLN